MKGMELEYIDISRDVRTKGYAEQRSAARRQRRERELRRRRQRRRVMMIRMAVLAGMIGVAGMAGFGLFRLIEKQRQPEQAQETLGEQLFFSQEKKDIIKPNITEDFLTVNPYSRPGESLPEVKNIFVHYTANQNTSAAQNRSYFESLSQTGETSASAHFIIGYEGEIIQCIPLDEIAYAVVGRNYDSVSIECCYRKEDGEFTQATYDSLIWLCSWLLQEYDLAPEDILRHYDEGGKKCPLYFVEHEEAWKQLIRDVEEKIS